MKKNKKNKNNNLNISLDALSTFLVGGAVRDELLGLQPREHDWVVIGSSKEQMLALGFQQVGKDFPVFLHPKTREEYALARTERKTAKGYYGFHCNFSPDITLEQDLERRDLTINALAKDLDGNIIDPFGGVKDLNARVLRHVSDAFIEDPLRVLRVARFAAKLAKFDFTVAPETIELMSTIVNNNELEYLTKERVWLEIEKTLVTDHPNKFFLVLRQCGALAVIFPALNKLWGVPQSIKWHPEVDTGLHTMLALEQIVKLTQDPKIRFAVLCHDLGKGVTEISKLPSHHGHEDKAVALINNWCATYKVPNDYKDLAVKVAKWHLHCHLALELQAKTILNLFEYLDAFRKPKNLAMFLLACTADAKGRLGKEHSHYVQAQFLQEAFNAVNKITATQFIKKGATGKKIGELIRKARINVLKKLSRAES